MRKTSVLVLVFVAAGLVPLACQPKPDAGVAAIVVPQDTLMRDTAVTPQVVLRNFVKRSVDASVRLMITTASGASVYDTTETAIALAANDSVIHTFQKQWQAAPAGVLTATAYTILDKDDERSNDTARATCWVVTDTAADGKAVQTLVKQDTVHFSGGTSGDSTENSQPMDDTTLGIWWRGPQTHDSVPTIDVQVQGDSAWVGWHQHNYGEIYHWVRTSESTAVKWTKPLQEAVQINAIYRREGKATDTDRGWRLKKISLAYGQSETTNTVRIDSLKIHSSLRDILIVGPLDTYFLLDSLIAFTPGEQLNITLYTNATDGYGWLHAFWGWLFVRLPFDSQGDGIYTGTWSAQIIPGFRFAIFDLMTKSTLMDPAAPYDYSGWLLPYKIQTAE